MRPDPSWLKFIPTPGELRAVARFVDCAKSAAQGGPGHDYSQGPLCSNCGAPADKRTMAMLIGGALQARFGGGKRGR